MSMTRMKFLSMTSSGLVFAAAGPARLLAAGGSKTVTYTVDFFTPLKGKNFTVRTGNGQVGLVLEDVKAGPTDPSTNQFSLLFNGAKTSKLLEGTYTVTHTGLDSFTLHIVPAGVRSDGKKLYRADFNILKT